MKFDISKLVTKARASKSGASEPSTDAPPAPGDDEGGDYSCGERAIAALKHGDAEAFEEAIRDIVNK
jgi:hypothetical protein